MSSASSDQIMSVALVMPPSLQQAMPRNVQIVGRLVGSLSVQPA